MFTQMIVGMSSCQKFIHISLHVTLLHKDIGLAGQEGLQELQVLVYSLGVDQGELHLGQDVR